MKYASASYLMPLFMFREKKALSYSSAKYARSQLTQKTTISSSPQPTARIKTISFMKMR